MEEITKEERKHTPGPWRFDDLEFKIKGTDDANFHTVIANVSPKMDYSRGMTTQSANAQLIAAAPELLDCLIDLLKDLPVDVKGNHYKKVKKAESVIKKATT